MTLEEIISKYPKIFKEYKGYFGNWECPDGWLPLVDKLCSNLQFNTDKNNFPQVECLQVKEKFGGLRFYTNGCNDTQDGAISFAESLSYKICMECGSMNNVKQTNNGWVETLCETHFK